MDTKHIPFDDEYEDCYTNLLSKKYAARMPDVILSADNNAFEFLKRRGSHLFPGVPVVFCGVNFFKAEHIEGFNNFTGVVETFDIRATLTAALAIHPDTKFIYLINDHLPSGKLAMEESKRDLADFTIDIPVEFAENLPISGIEQRLQKLPEHSLVVLGAFFRDADDIYYLPADSLSRFKQAAPNIPIYGQLDTHIGLGIIGGYLIDGEAQGRYAMEMALQVLNGRPVSEIPVRTQHTNSYIFDWTEMERFGIRVSQLPAESIVINKPFSVWEQYRWYIIGIIIILTAQALTISLLLSMSRQRSKALKELDEERLLLEKRVDERTEELQHSNRQMKELNDTRDKFFSIISHDLRGPLGAIIGATELLMKIIETGDSEKIKMTVNMLNNAGIKTYKLLENLLEWSKMQTGKIIFNPEPFNLEPLIDEVVQLLKNNAVQKNITIDVKIPGPIQMIADINMIYSMLRNLLSNAIKFTPRGGSVTIQAAQEETTIEISISDTGVGMEKELVDRLFYIGEKTTREGTEKEEGTGLGLLLCKDFADKHGGKILVESEPGKGSNLRVIIPRNKTSNSS
jgi:signal transduction histidine kinase